MTIERMDHFTILTRDSQATAKFYGDMLGFESGPRPNFAFPGIWLHCNGKPILHVIQKAEIPEGAGVLDHMAFWAKDLPGYVAKLKARGIKYDLRRLPQGGFAEGVWQLFFFDPNGAKVELDFDKNEPAPEGA
ncbi:MAG: VOC family protein [Proteobacteria bacterium]|nr:VOC family protein [Pseudomonadota bacterium]